MPAVRERYARKFRYLMVDEYQDTNRPQYLLITQLAASASQPVRGRRSRPIDLQVAWRRPSQHSRLRARLSRSRHSFSLERNYRSTQVILDAASAVISNNRNRKEKTLWTDRKGGAKITYFRGADELEEAEFITRIARRVDRRRRQCVDGRAVSDQRAVERGRRCAAPGQHRLRRARGRRLLRAQGNQGRAVVSQADSQPAR